jgi:hypothetical protein
MSYRGEVVNVGEPQGHQALRQLMRDDLEVIRTLSQLSISP